MFCDDFEGLPVLIQFTEISNVNNKSKIDQIYTPNAYGVMVSMLDFHRNDHGLDSSRAMKFHDYDCTNVPRVNASPLRDQQMGTSSQLQLSYTPEIVRMDVYMSDFFGKSFYGFLSMVWGTSLPFRACFKPRKLTRPTPSTPAPPPLPQPHPLYPSPFLG